MSDMRERLARAMFEAELGPLGRYWHEDEAAGLVGRWYKLAEAAMREVEAEIGDLRETADQALIQVSRLEAKLEDYTRTIDDLAQWKHDNEARCAALVEALVSAERALDRCDNHFKHGARYVCDALCSVRAALRDDQQPSTEPVAVREPWVSPAECRERERRARIEGFNAGCLYGWDHGYGRNETCTDGEAEAARRYPEPVKEEK